MQPAIQQKQTPTNRRPGGRNRNNPHQKTYASENDVPRYKPDSFVNPSTPQKSVSGEQSQRANSTGQKQRNRNNNSSKKPRHKNGALSPGLNKLNQQLQSKEASAPIFAGSTFHASPAPSALPIPSFLSKSEAESPAPKATSSPDQGLSSPSTESDEASPPSPTCVPRTDESPLEFFFRADRAEKAQTRRASSANSTNGDAIPIGPFSPPRGSPMERNTPLKSAESRTARRPQYQKRSTVTGISPNELDGNPGQPVGPAFSTPFQERIRAARPNQNSAHGTPTMVRNQDLNSRLDSPDALKRYLFTGRLGSDDEQPTPSKQSSQEQTQSAHQRARQQHRMPRGMFPASVLTANAQSSPSTAPPAHAQLTPYRSEQLLAMEDGLKRMLKLDSSSQSLPLR